MKILAIADLHGTQHRMNTVLNNIQKHSPDLVVICGDITHLGPGEMAKNLLDQIPIDAIAVKGNMDPIEVSKGINDSSATNIDMRKVIKKGIPFVGINGVNEEQIKEFFSKNEKLVDETTVIVSHVPPYGFQDENYSGVHYGSKELKNIVECSKPRLVLCGHVHENPGFTKIDNTTVVNCSIGNKGEGALIDIEDVSISVKMLEY